MPFLGTPCLRRALYGLTDHLVADQRTRGQSLFQQPAGGRILLRLIPQHVPGRETGNPQPSREPGALRPFTAPRCSQKQDDAPSRFCRAIFGLGFIITFPQYIGIPLSISISLGQPV